MHEVLSFRFFYFLFASLSTGTTEGIRLDVSTISAFARFADCIPVNAKILVPTESTINYGDESPGGAWRKVHEANQAEVDGGFGW